MQPGDHTPNYTSLTDVTSLERAPRCIGSLRLGKICRRRAQDLVGLPQLAVLALRRLQPVGQLGRHTSRLSLFTSAFFTHSSSVCPEQPIMAAIEAIAAHRDGCSLS